MSNPYMSGPHQFDVVGGETECFEIRAPHRGVITQIKFDQVAGDAANCDFEVFTARSACFPETTGVTLGSGSSSSSSSSSTGSALPDGNNPSSYSIFGAKTYTAGTPLSVSDESHTFRNQDGTYSVPQRRLYVKLTPSGTGPKTFALTLEMLTSLLQ
jgi:hypothetical protein